MTDNLAIEPADKFYNKSEDTELVKEPTKETDVTDGNIKTIQDVELDKPPLEGDKPKSEELESDDKNKETQYLDLDGKETSLDDVRMWREGHMMQSDYTKKTTEHARQVETDNAEIKSNREELLKSQTEVSELRDQLQALVQEDEEIDWAELKVDDPDRYIELKELADKRKDAVAKIKSERDTPLDGPAFIAEEQRKLFAANPEWLDDDKKPTDLFKAETQLMNEWASDNGYSSDDFKRLNKSHFMMTILKAAKFDKLQEKGKKIKSDREKVPVVLKPKGKNSEQATTKEERFYGKQA